MTQYIGVLDGSGKTYGVRIPDLPGCYGGGATPEAAITDAMSAARFAPILPLMQACLKPSMPRLHGGASQDQPSSPAQRVKGWSLHDGGRGEVAGLGLKNLSMVVPGLDPGINPTTQT